jgi:hypothetical protein
MEGSDHVVLTTAQKVRALWKSVSAVKVGIQPIRELWSDGTYRALWIRRLFPETLIKVFKLMPPDREVYGGLLVGVHMNRILVDVFLGGKRIVSFHSSDLENQMRGRGSRLWRGR